MISQAIDKLVSIFNPTAAIKRVKARASLSLYDSVYAGASMSKRSMKNWRPWASKSPDEEVLPDREELIARCRDQYKNNPIARGAINTPLLNVVGPGLIPQCRIDRETLKLSDEEADAWESNVEMLYDQWSNHTDADAARRENFPSLQSLAYLSYLQSGEVFAFMPLIPRPGTVSDLRVMLVETDRVSTPDDKYDSGSLQAGIETGTYGEPVAYWVETTVPVPFGVVNRNWTRIPAYGRKSGRQNCVHLYRQERPGQRRGIPSLSPVLVCLKQIAQYSEAELMAAVISAMFTVFLESGEEMVAGVTDPEGALPNEETAGLGYGATVRLDPGEKISLANPGRPNVQFDPFVQAILKQIGMGLNIPYEVLVKSFNSSYSASRAAIMEAWRHFSSERKWFVMKFCQPIYEEWLMDMVVRGKIIAPGFLESVQIRRSYCITNWQGPVPLSIDPVKEVNAAKIRIETKLTTTAEETANLTSGDWKNNYRQIAKERKLSTELGIDHVEGFIMPEPVVDTPDDKPDEKDKKTKVEKDV